MGVAAREIEREVMSVLHGSGAQVLGKGRDGAGHQTVTFTLNGQEKMFHYGSSQHMNGCARKNLTTRLRHLLRDIPPAPPLLTLVPKSEPIDARPVVELPPPPTPPKPRLNAARRKEIAKRYVKLRSIVDLATETGLTTAKLHILLNAAGGDPQMLYRKDLNRKRAEAGRIKRGDAPIIFKKAAAKAKAIITPVLPDLPPSKRGAYADNFRRNILITKMVAVAKHPIEVVAKHAGVSATRITQIVKEYYVNRHWKLD